MAPPRKCLDDCEAIILEFAHRYGANSRLHGGTMLTKSKVSGLALYFIFFNGSAATLASGQSDLPRVLVIATGGTIAGEQGEPGTLGGYDIRKTINEVLGSVPEVRKYAQIETEQFSNIPSPNITPEQWLQLARRINAAFEKRTDLAGVVVTHGTSRLEETAFFLHLTVKFDRPVVVVGAQRPATGISPDGRDGGDGRPNPLRARCSEGLCAHRRLFF